MRACPAVSLLALLVFAPVACSDDADPAGGNVEPTADTSAVVTDGTQEIPQTEAAQAEHASMLDREFPLHGLVTGLQLAVRSEPNPEAEAVGWLRIGNRVRLKDEEPQRTSTCATGWYRLYPQGWACAGQGIEIGNEPPQSELAVPPPERESPLPYTYWFVKEPMTPEYHQAPSRDDQRAATVFAERYLELLEQSEPRAARFLAGELPNEPQKPPVVHRFLDRGFFVAGVGVETRADRNFVRTVRGRFVKQAQLIERTGSEFVGVELNEETRLPIVWAVREAHYRIKREREEGIRWVIDRELEPIARHTIVDNWIRSENIGGDTMHVLETPNGERYIRDWFLSVAEPMDRPRRVAEDEPWVHVDLDQQTLVLYAGDTPTYATLVSSGAEGHETPTGTFTIRRKYIADTMANVGGGLEDRYSIEDVPWTQYFEGSIALHGAFWHSRFGLTKSHGCVNLAPQDAHRVFDALWPRVPDGWLGVDVHQGAFRASHVVVTE